MSNPILGEKAQNCSERAFEVASKSSSVWEASWKTQDGSSRDETEQSSTGAKDERREC